MQRGSKDRHHCLELFFGDLVSYLTGILHLLFCESFNLIRCLGEWGGVVLFKRVKR